MSAGRGEAASRAELPVATVAPAASAAAALLYYGSARGRSTGVGAQAAQCLPKGALARWGNSDALRDPGLLS